MKYTSAQLLTKRGHWQGQLKYKDETGYWITQDGVKFESLREARDHTTRESLTEPPKAETVWRSKQKALTAKGKREALRELEAWRDELEAQAQAEALGAGAAGRAGETVAEYLRRYIDGKAATVERSTLSEYRRLASKQIAPYIGAIPLDELTPDDVQEWITELAKKYKPMTTRKAFTLLRSAMKQAVERDRIPKNPTRSVGVPKLTAQNPNALDGAERTKVLRVVEIALEGPQPSPVMLGVMIALYTGMREGEICALRWSCVDLEAGAVTVSEAVGIDKTNGHCYIKPPKTEDSARVIYFPETLGRALTARRAAMVKECLAAGVRFTDQLFVIGDVDGVFMRPRYISEKWQELACALDLKGTQGKRPTFHDLRHTYATVAIANGVDVKTVSNAMGHSNAAMTLNTYASTDKAAAKKAAQTMGEAYATETARAEEPARIVELRKTGTEE